MSGYDILELYERLKRSQNNVRFEDALRLAELAGFAKRRLAGRKQGGGSDHHIYRHETLPVFLNFQDDHGKAKPYQVKQLLKAIEENNLLAGERRSPQ